MNRIEFIQRCQMGGYCSKQAAEKYAEGKEEFTETDIENVYRDEQNRISKSEADKRFVSYMGAKSTKRVYNGRRNKYGSDGAWEWEDE